MASSCTVDPAHTVDGVAVGAELKALPVTVTFILSLFEHVVADDVAVNVNVVVVDKLTVVGSSTNEFTSSADGVQL